MEILTKFIQAHVESNFKKGKLTRPKIIEAVLKKIEEQPQLKRVIQQAAREEKKYDLKCQKSNKQTNTENNEVFFSKWAKGLMKA